MEFKSEIISISKIRDGLFIGDNRAGTNLDLLMQFKISHIINATGIPLPYSFESLGIKYLTINWTENPPENTVIINDDLILNIIKFIDESNANGEGLLGFSVTGKNRICVVIILYLMSKYNWTLKNCLEYVRKKKHDVDINNFYMNQLEIYEKDLINKNNFFNSPSNWNSDNIKDRDELVMRNTYMNEVNKNKNLNENKSDNNNQYKILRKVEWGDNKKYARQMAQPGLIHYNVDKDLFLKTNIEDITEHLHMKPLRSCIKNNVYTNTTININSIKNKVSSTTRRKKTKIFLAADVHTVNNSNKDCGIDLNNLNSIKEEKQNGFFLTQGRSKDNEIERENKVIDGDKMNIFEDISLTDKNDDVINNLIQIKGIKDKDNREKTEKPKNKMYAKDKIIIDSKKRECNNNERSKPKENTPIDDKHIINNLNILKDIDNNDSEDEIKLNIINMNKNKEKEKEKGKNQNKSESEDKKELKKTMKEYGFNIVNVEKKSKDATIANFNTEIRPILENLLKIDPNLETLNKYLKSKKKNTYLNFSDTFSKNNLDKVKKNKTNTNPKNDTISINNNLNAKNDNDKGNSTSVNLVPINLNKTSQNKKTKSKNKDDKNNNNNKLYLFNLNLNIENTNTININNNIINNNNNKGFNRKLNNFFTDEYGNYFQGFNNKKKRNTYSARTGEQKNFNNYNNNQQFLSPNVNYYLANVPHTNKNKEKKGNTIIPNINYNNNHNHNYNNRINHSTHSQKSSKNKSNKEIKKNSQTKIFMRPTININKNNINNAINANKNFLITSIANSNNMNGFNRKESKYNTI